MLLIPGCQSPLGLGKDAAVKSILYSIKVASQLECCINANFNSVFRTCNVGIRVYRYLHVALLPKQRKHSNQYQCREHCCCQPGKVWQDNVMQVEKISSGCLAPLVQYVTPSQVVTPMAHLLVVIMYFVEVGNIDSICIQSYTVSLYDLMASFNILPGIDCRVFLHIILKLPSTATRDEHPIINHCFNKFRICILYTYCFLKFKTFT